MNSITIILLKMELWNQKDLNPPASCSFHCKKCTIDIIKLKSTLEEAIDKFTNQDALHAEAAMLSRCIYRMKQKFRKDKGFKAMEKINRALRQYLNLNFCTTLKSFYNNMPDSKDREIYLPTRNLLDFVLVRLMGLTKLCIRIAEVCKETCMYMESKIAIGHFWKVALIAMSISSRIWFFARDIFELCSNLHSYLLGIRGNFENVGNDWLPKHFILPEDIREWSDGQIFLEAPSEPKQILPASNVLDIEDSSDEDIGIGFENPQSEKCKDESIKINHSEDTEDIGVKVEVKVKKTNEVKRQIKPAPKITPINNIKDGIEYIESLNVDGINMLISSETRQRKIDKMQCIFKNVDDSKWEKVVKIIKKNIKKSDQNSVDKIKKILRAALKNK